MPRFDRPGSSPAFLCLVPFLLVLTAAMDPGLIPFAAPPEALIARPTHWGDQGPAIIWLSAAPAPHVPGNTEFERFDNAVRKVLTVPGRPSHTSPTATIGDCS